MRLTLRTMLAYLDDVLEPTDAEQIGKKIQDSEFASGLVHRLRSTTRKLRLGAPKLEGQGMGLDANTVAEYLDSTLPTDRVPDFEKVCLESDVHLAEIASCHQVLALVLGEPADVAPQVRQRIYRIGSLASPGTASIDDDKPAVSDERPKIEESKPQQAPQPAPTVAGTESAQQQKPVTPPPTEKVERAKPEIPDYLKATSRRGVLPYVITAVLVFLIAMVAFLSIGTKTIAGLFQEEKPAPPAQTQEADKETDKSPPTLSKGTDDLVQPLKDDTDVSDTKDPDSVSDDTSTDVPSPMKEPTDSDTNVKPEPKDVTDDSPKPDAPDTPMPKPPVDDSVDKGKPKDAADPLTDIAKVDVGRYVSEKQIMARFDPVAGNWRRVAAGAAVSSGDRLLALPNFRPQLELVSSVHMTVADASLIDLNTLDERGSPQLSMTYGRVVFATDKAGARVGLNLGGRRGIATLTNADTVMAIDVRRYLPPGSNPASDPAKMIVQILAVRGQIEWNEAGDGTAIDEQNALVMVDDEPGTMVEMVEFPQWITTSHPEVIDELASETLETFVDLDRRMVVSLEERVADTRVEVRVLASRCLSYFNRHESFVNLMADAQAKSYWLAGFKTAVQAVERSPESAEAVHAALKKRRGEDADKLYRMLWGYTDEQLRGDDEAAVLVQYLSHESLDYRVLAFLNLERITGYTHFYRPEVPARRRATSTQKWNQKAENGMIVRANPPSLPIVKTRTDKSAIDGAK